MFVNGTYYTAIWLDQNHPEIVKIINQQVLPFRFEIKDLRTSEDVFHAIKNMEVRGAPLIGITGAYGVYLAALEAKGKDNPLDYIKQRADYLKTTRPTAVNLSYAIDKVLAGISREDVFNDIIANSREQAALIKDQEIEDCRKIGIAGLPVLEEISKKKKGKPVHILTHCNAGWIACGDYGTATAPIYLAHDNGIPVHVWVDETRPRNQGARLTAWELGEHGVPHTVIADNTGGHLMQHGKVDLVMVGSDRTTVDGDVANKIGTYLKALAAKDNNIPFYVALPSSTIDFGMKDGLRSIPIEERDEKEVRHIEGYIDEEIKSVRLIPEKSKALNYGFDVTPARLVTGLITERGICKPYIAAIQKMFPEKSSYGNTKSQT